MKKSILPILSALCASATLSAAPANNTNANWVATVETAAPQQAAATLPAPSHNGNATLTWHGAIGTHYRLAPESYLGTTRSYPTPSKFSYIPDVTRLAPENIAPVTGKFSGEKRQYDFTNKVPRPGSFDYTQYLRDATRARIDLIWNIGQINYLDTDHVELVMAKNGAYYKDLIYATVTLTETGEFKNKPVEIYWEVGNEINSYRRFALFNKGTTQNNLGKTDDYVEYFLAPAVEAIRAASLDTRGNPRAIKILLGNVMMPDRKETRAFLDKIINTTVKGTHAPTLAGKKVHELIDAIGLHYTDGKHDINGYYYDKYIATGKTPAIWNTEELGNTGLGDYDIARVSFRYLTYWAQKPWAPDTARLIFWGDRGEKDPADPTVRKDGLYSETTGREMLRHLGEFFQNHPLTALQASIDYKYEADVNLETHALRAQVTPNKYKIALLVLPRSDADIASITLKNLQGCLLKLTAYEQPIQTAKKEIPVTHTQTTDTLSITNLRLPKNTALLLELEYEQ